MANTYDDFLKKAKEMNLYDKFSAQDLSLAESFPDAGMSLITYKNDYNNAPTDEARALANMEANQIRSTYGGYTGGKSGSQYSLNKEQSSFPSQYGTQQKSIIEALRTQPKFSYDKNTDPLYKSYEDTYKREGRNAMLDVLGDVSSRTGGLASSYGTAAAQNTYNQYAKQIADMLPKLEQQSYDRYQDDRNQQTNMLGILNNQDNIDYTRFLDQVDQNKYNQERQDSMAAAEQERALAEQNSAAESQQANVTLARKQVDAMIEAGLGSSISPTLLSQVGYDPAYVQSMSRYYTQQAAAKRAGTGSGSGNGNGANVTATGSESEASEYSVDKMDSIFAKAQQNNDIISAEDWEYLIKEGGLAEDQLYEQGYTRGGNTQDTTVSNTPTKAVSYVVDGVGKISADELNSYLSQGYSMQKMSDNLYMLRESR